MASCCRCTSICIAVGLSLILCVSVLCSRQCPDKEFITAAVAADSGTCSEIGRDILRKGGSAVDGAIAALLCTSVFNPQSTGIGGGSIFTVMDSTGKVKIINARETVPLRFKPDLLSECSKDPKFISGSQWIGVPGEIRGYEEAHKRYGKLPWADLFEPTIKLAREGFPIHKILDSAIQNSVNIKTQQLSKLFSDKNGNMLKAGDIVKFEKLADTLETISREGANAFYTGKIAEDLIRDIQDAGGTLSMEDLASYKVRVTDALTIPLDEYTMYVPPPPAGGVILSFILNIMKGYNLDVSSLKGDKMTLTYHHYIEACKFANGLKRYIRDPKFSTEGTAERLTEQSFADHVRGLISPNQVHDLQYYNITPYIDSMGTTHVSVLAKDGSAVSVTSTINHFFGCKVLSPSTGIVLNNELSDFCGKTEHIVPGEQPPSSMSPAVLKSKSNTLVIGASGGSMITTGMVSTLMNHLWFGKSLQEAVNTRVVHVDSENKLKFETGFDKSVIDALLALGHKEHETQKDFYNVVNTVEKNNDCIWAVSDARKNGKPAFLQIDAHSGHEMQQLHSYLLSLYGHWWLFLLIISYIYI